MPVVVFNEDKVYGSLISEDAADQDMATHGTMASKKASVAMQEVNGATTCFRMHLVGSKSAAAATRDY